MVQVDREGRQRLRKRLLRAQSNFASRFAQVKAVTVNSKDLTVNKARLLGHVLFDGIATRYLISYSTASQALAQQFLNDLRLSYRGLKPRIRAYESKNMDVYDVSGASIIACSDIRRFLENPDVRSLQHLKPAVMSSESNLLVQIARAFLEDEGSISGNGNITGGIKNRGLRNQLVLIHERLGIDISPYKDRVNRMFGIYVRREHGNLQRFDQFVGFRKGVVTQGRNVGVLKRAILLDNLNPRRY